MSTLKLGGGEQKIAKQHAAEKLTARERLALLIDDGNFVELSLHGKPHFSQRAMDPASTLLADGVITGYPARSTGAWPRSSPTTSR